MRTLAIVALLASCAQASVACACAWGMPTSVLTDAPCAATFQGFDEIALLDAGSPHAESAHAVLGNLVESAVASARTRMIHGHAAAAIMEHERGRRRVGPRLRRGLRLHVRRLGTGGTA